MPVVISESASKTRPGCNAGVIKYLRNIWAASGHAVDFGGKQNILHYKKKKGWWGISLYLGIKKTTWQCPLNELYVMNSL